MSYKNDGEQKSKGTIVAKRLGEGSSSAVNLKLGKGKEFMGEGTMGKVSRIHVRRHRGEDLPFVHKVVRHADEEFFKGRIQVHQRLLSARHSEDFTYPTLRITKDGYIMTDLSEGGKNLVFSWNELQGTGRERLLGENPTLLRTFSKLDLKNVDTKATRVAIEAARVDVRLSADSMIFVMKPDGTYRLVVGDMDNPEIVTDEGRMLFGKDLAERNQEALEYQRAVIEDMRQIVRKHLEK